MASTKAEEPYEPYGETNQYNYNPNNNNLLDEEEENKEISQEDGYQVIAAYFQENGLVSQQINSFDYFLTNGIQDTVEEVGKITIKPGLQYRPDEKKNSMDGQTYELKFEQLHVYQRPTYRDKDRLTHNVYPTEARLRNLTYESELFMDVRCRIYSYDEDTGEEKTFKNELMEKIPIGKVPIMVRSKFCALYGLTDTESIGHGECFFDQGGYFIIKGGEKVVVAQEKMANNFVYVFKNKDNSGYSWEAEIRSYLEGSNRPPSKLS